ncbi:MAG: DUF1570 domain-containing protein [Pseudomonadota bacterium]
MQRQLISLGIFLVLGTAGLYVAYPDVSGGDAVEQPAVTLPPIVAADVPVEPTPEPRTPAPLPIPVVEPEVVEVPVAASTFTEAQTTTTCSAPPTEAVTRNEPSIYRWTDASGRIHFSDKKPAAATAELYKSDGSGELNYFDLAINYRGQNMVPFLHDQLSAQATSIYKIMTDLVGSEQLKHVRLNIVMFPDSESFHRYAQASTGISNPNIGGYYSTASNEAVTFTYPDDNRTMEVAKHEAAHVIAMGIMGKVPLWLNEGLAEYFSKLSVRSQLSQVTVQEEWLPLARATVESGYPQRFAEFLKLEPEGWRNEHEANHYALAWSLVYFMLGTDTGQQTLAKLMLQMATQYCQPLDSAQELARSYPGGLLALEKEFYAWLMDDAVKAPHTY